MTLLEIYANILYKNILQNIISKIIENINWLISTLARKILEINQDERMAANRIYKATNNLEVMVIIINT